MNSYESHRVLRSVAVFCGASLGNDPRFSAGARELGTLLASRGIALLYGGGNVGLMGAIADAALAAGGKVIGVIPRVLVEREVAHRGITEQIVVETMHERKQILADRSDAFVAMPGGYGTFDELFEAVTWNQLGIQDKPVGLLNVAGFYDHLIAMLDHAASVALVPPANRRLVLASRDAAELIAMLERAPAGPGGRWGAGERR